MDYKALAAEIAKPVYDGLGDEDCASYINTTAAPVVRPVQSSEVRRLLMVAGKWPRIAAVARGLIAPTDESQALAAIALVEALVEITSFDLTVLEYANAVDAQLNAAVATGLIDAAHKAAILNLQNATGTIAEAIGWHAGVTPSNVADARRL